MAKHPNQLKIEEAMRSQGDTLDFNYVLECLENGRMQSFSEGDSLLITEIQNYPKKKVLHVVAAVGEMDEILKMEPRFEEFARRMGCSMITASGRSGWSRVATEGWNTLYTTYGKDIH